MNWPGTVKIKESCSHGKNQKSLRSNGKNRNRMGHAPLGLLQGELVKKNISKLAQVPKPRVLSYEEAAWQHQVGMKIAIREGSAFAKNFEGANRTWIDWIPEIDSILLGMISPSLIILALSHINDLRSSTCCQRKIFLMYFRSRLGLIPISHYSPFKSVN